MPICNGDLKEVASLFDNLMSLDKTIEEVCSADVLCRIIHKIERQTEALKQSRTACLWLQCMDMKDILILPYFLTAGHALYGMSARVRKQHAGVGESTPCMFTRASNSGNIRRSDRYWAGVLSYLVIEQVLMRSVNTKGGLTLGRGLTETQRLAWLLSMPACAIVNCTLQDLTAVTYNTSDQHKESTRARQGRDSKDTEELLKVLQSRNPFTDDRCLRSISIIK